MKIDLNKLIKFLFSISDQFFVVGTIFLLNIFLARTQNKEEYGYFVLTYSLFTLLLGVYNALILEPYTVFGSGKYSHIFSKYGAFMFRNQLVVGILISGFLLLLLSIISITKLFYFKYSFLGLAIVISLLMTSHFIRRTFYIHRKIISAALMSIMFFGIVIIGTLLLNKFHRLSSFSAFILLGVSWIFVFIFFIRKEIIFHGSEDFIRSNANYWHEHWNYSRWILLTALIFQLTGQGYYWLLSSILSTAEVAEMKAVQNITGPVEQVFIALSLLTFPLLAKYHSERIKNKFLLILKQVLFFSITATIFYACFLWLLGHKILHILYAGKYDNSLFIMYPLSIVPIIMGVGNCFNDALKAIGNPNIIFYAYLTSGLVTIIVGIPLIKNLGLVGVAYGMLISSTAYCVFLILGYYSKRYKY